MYEVQSQDLSGHQGPGTSEAASPPRLLEDAGVVKLYDGPRVVLTAHGAVELVECKHGANLRWLRWKVAEFTFERSAVLFLLGGGTLKQLFGPRYSILGTGYLSPWYTPTPRIHHVVLAEPLVEGDVLEYMNCWFGGTSAA